MKKNGFTLTELLGVITVLGLIALIVFPNVNKSIKNSKKKLYDQQVSLIEKNARRWGVEHSDLLPNSGSIYYLNLEELITGGYISQKTVKDPRDNSAMGGCVVIIFNDDYNQYEYTYDEACGTGVINPPTSKDDIITDNPDAITDSDGND